jgi:hypothetical protein
MTTAAAFLLLRLMLAALLLAILIVILVELRRGLRPMHPAGAALPMACLVPGLPTENQASFALAGMNSIGRAPGNSITLDHPSVSSYHARLSFGSGRWLLEDLGSRNGTRLNGLEVSEPLPINDGDRLQFGSVEFRLMAGGMEPPGVPAGQGPEPVTAPAAGLQDASGPAAEA